MTRSLWFLKLLLFHYYIMKKFLVNESVKKQAVACSYHYFSLSVCVHVFCVQCMHVRVQVPLCVHTEAIA